MVYLFTQSLTYSIQARNDVDGDEGIRWWCVDGSVSRSRSRTWRQTCRGRCSEPPGTQGRGRSEAGGDTEAGDDGEDGDTEAGDDGEDGHTVLGGKEWQTSRRTIID